MLLSHRLNTGKKSKVIFLDRITSFDKNLKIFFQLFNRLGNTSEIKTSGYNWNSFIEDHASTQK